MPDKGMSGLDKAKYVLFGKSQNSAYVWQDREVRFDCPISALECRRGETVIDTLVTEHDTIAYLAAQRSSPLVRYRAKLKTPKATMASKASSL